MRKVIDPQLKFGEQDISAIHLDPKSRDDIPQILRGLQYIYTTPKLREAVFTILEEVIPQGMEGKANPDTGRPGMEQWKILVLGVLRIPNVAHGSLYMIGAFFTYTIAKLCDTARWANITAPGLGQTLADFYTGKSCGPEQAGGDR